MRVPKRVERHAVGRNLSRRLVREAFRERRCGLAPRELLFAQTRAFGREERALVRAEIVRLLEAYACEP